MATDDPRRERRPDQPVLDAMALLDAGRGTVEAVRAAAKKVLDDGSLKWDEHVEEYRFLRDVLPNRSDDEVRAACKGMAAVEGVESDDRRPIIVRSGKVELRSIEELWINYRMAVIPGELPVPILREFRLAFYAGVASMFDMATLGVGDDSVSEDEGLAYFDRVRDELDHFRKILEAELAGRMQARSRIIHPYKMN